MYPVRMGIHWSNSADPEPKRGRRWKSPNRYASPAAAGRRKRLGRQKEATRSGGRYVRSLVDQSDRSDRWTADVSTDCSTNGGGLLRASSRLQRCTGGSCSVRLGGPDRCEQPTRIPSRRLERCRHGFCRRDSHRLRLPDHGVPLAVFRRGADCGSGPGSAAIFAPEGSGESNRATLARCRGIAMTDSGGTPQAFDLGGSANRYG